MRGTETLLALFVAAVTAAAVTSCGLFATTDKAGIARDAAAVAAIEQHCELEQKMTAGQAGARAEVDARCERELDELDAKGAP